MKATVTVGVPFDSVGRGGNGDRGAAHGRRPVWLHLDVDVLDEAIFPATDCLQPGGLDWEELGALPAPLGAAGALVGASLACHNPDKEPGLACGRRPAAALGQKAR